MVSLPLDDRPVTLRSRIGGAIARIGGYMAVVGAAIRVADAVESHMRPKARDLRILGIRELPRTF
jgi:hypothetical protein